MSVPFTPPEHLKPGFHCPHCRVYAEQTWHVVILNDQRGTQFTADSLRMAKCRHCAQLSIWLEAKMIFPDVIAVDVPNPDLNDDIRADYVEAAGILSRSPRGAAALLRLAIQKVCSQVGKPGVKINDDIAALVRDGLPAQVQQSLDIVRVVGNNAVHPGQIDLKDDQVTALRLFNLVNLIAQIMITNPKQVKEFYSSLPEDERAKIEERNRKARGNASNKN